MVYDPTIDFNTEEGLQLFGAALYHLLTNFGPHHGLPAKTFDRVTEGTINLFLERLRTPNNVREKAKELRIADFSFHWFDLFRYQELVQFIFRPEADVQMIVDRRTPIARNQDILRRSQPFDLFFETAELHLNPNAPWPEPKNTTSEMTFRTLLHHATRRNEGRGAPRGARYEDFRKEAAARAWHLLWECVEKGVPTPSRREVVREVLKSFQILPPEKMPDQRLFMHAASEARACELVVEELEQLLKDYPLTDE